MAKKQIDFLKKWLNKPKETGGIAQSSDELAKLMILSAQLEKAEYIVEYGPGTGVFSKRILKEKNEKAIFFAIESNIHFVEELKQTLPQMEVIHGSAEHINTYLKEKDITQVDIIISGLPWTVFDGEKQEDIIGETIKSLRKKGKFLTFAYYPLCNLPAGKRFHELLKKQFSTVEKTRIIWKNLPAAFIYVCEK